MMERVEDSDFEVSIAVSFPRATAETRDNLEGFFGEYGFEYVNDSTSSGSAHEHDLDDVDGQW
jgi:hypothetical protein